MSDEKGSEKFGEFQGDLWSFCRVIKSEQKIQNKIKSKKKKKSKNRKMCLKGIKEKLHNISTPLTINSTILPFVDLN